MSTDGRVYNMRMFRSIPITQSIPFFYPRMFAIHNLQPEVNIFLGLRVIRILNM